MTKPRAFVIGHPVGHSRSPLMHGYWLDRYGIEGTYEKLDVPSAELGNFFTRFRRERYIGANVTVPHKVAVMDHVDRIDHVAEAMGAINCLWWEDDMLVGGNTDALGFLESLDEAVPEWDLSARHAVILGAGGAARAAGHGLRSRGLGVALVNRTIERAVGLADQLGPDVTTHPRSELADLLARTDVLVNATTQGMVGQPALETDLSPLGPNAVVCDLVYAPLDTMLLLSARRRGLRTVDGLGMLLHQGAAGFARWFGIRPDVTSHIRGVLADDIRSST